MIIELCDDLEDVKKQFTELKNSKKEIYFQVVAGKYKDSVLKATNISVDNLRVQALSPWTYAKLSFKFYEIEFVENANITNFKITLPTDNEYKTNLLIDKLKNKIQVGDFITFSNNIFKKSDNIQFAEVLEITSNKKVLIKTIPQIAGEKSFTLRLRYKRNFLKLSKDQINSLVFNKLSKLHCHLYRRSDENG